MAPTDWVDAQIREALERKRDQLGKQIDELNHLLGIAPAPPVAAPVPRRAKANDAGLRITGPVIRAGRKPMSAEARKLISKRMKETWRKRKEAE
jgi:hypothetical protein